MVSIVVHGVLGASYRKDVVVDGGISNDDLSVLINFRQKLACDFSDNAPRTGWLLQPAPSGMWLCRLELAFDSNYTPSFIIFSFLIPKEYQLKDDSVLDLISWRLIQYHSHFIAQGLIRRDPDWDFLSALGEDVDKCLEPLSMPLTTYRKPLTEKIAYYPDTPSRMVWEMWSDKFSRFAAIFCGRRWLVNDQVFPNVNDAIEPDTEQKEEPETEAEQEEVLPNKPSEEANVVAPEPPQPVNTGSDGNNKHRLMMLLCGLLGVGLLVFLMFLVFPKDSKLKGLRTEMKDMTEQLMVDTPRYCGHYLYNAASGLDAQYKEEAQNLKAEDAFEDPTYLAFSEAFGYQTVFKQKDSMYYQRALLLLLKPLDEWSDDERGQWDGFMKEDANGRWSNDYMAIVHVDTVNVRYQKRKAELQKRVDYSNKIVINSASKVFLCLTWENVEDQGRRFYEKYKVSNQLKHRVDVIISVANSKGKSRYLKAYKEAERRSREEGKDELYLLEEQLLGSSNY